MSTENMAGSRSKAAPELQQLAPRQVARQVREAARELRR